MQIMIRVATSTKLDVTITSLQSKMRLSPMAMTMIPQQSYRNTHCHEAANGRWVFIVALNRFKRECDPYGYGCD
jgi:hypothetical protein